MANCCTTIISCRTRKKHAAIRSCPAYRGPAPSILCWTSDMSTVFKPDETFRGDFNYANSLAAIRRFPLPFPEDNYMYSVNIEPHVAGPAGSVTEFAFDVDEHYVAECRERALV